jgi:hypothetical protein
VLSGFAFNSNLRHYRPETPNPAAMKVHAENYAKFVAEGRALFGGK